MKTIKIQQLDFHYLLVENYKVLGLNEKELAIILLIDNVEKEHPTLITSDQLVLKMSIDEKEIDVLLTSLFERKYLSYETIDGIMITSIIKTKERIVELFKRDVVTSPIDDLLEIDNEEGKTIFNAFENKLNRALTPFELDTIKSWISEGIKKETIIDTLNECALKSKSVSLKTIDKMIIKNMTSKDRKKEGYSVVDEQHKKDIDEAIKIASYDWINN